MLVSPLREGTLLVLRAGLAVPAASKRAVRTGRDRRVRPLAAITLRRAEAASAPCAQWAAPSSIPLLTIWRNRGLIRVMVRRDILGRYRGSFGGAFWTIISPLLLMLTYFFVFGVVLQSRFGGDTSRVRVRPLFPGRHAALAGLQRGRRPRPQS